MAAGPNKVVLGVLAPTGIGNLADAAVLVAVLEDDSTIGAQFELTEGDDTIPDALASLR